MTENNRRELENRSFIDQECEHCGATSGRMPMDGTTWTHKCKIKPLTDRIEALEKKVASLNLLRGRRA